MEALVREVVFNITDTFQLLRNCLTMYEVNRQNVTYDEKLCMPNESCILGSMYPACFVCFPWNITQLEPYLVIFQMQPNLVKQRFCQYGL